MQEICSQARQKWDVKKMVMAHRTGFVQIGEASVMIVVSSAHRKEALEARV
jgi:molybdopterin synthase catalytic subunit